MLAVLSLQLSVEARVVRWTVQEEHGMSVEHFAYRRCGMRRGAIQAQDQGRAVELEVPPQGARDELCIVVRATVQRGAICDRTIGRDESEVVSFGAGQMHRIQAAQDARLCDRHAHERGFALAFHRRERLGLYARSGATRESLDTVT